MATVNRITLSNRVTAADNFWINEDDYQTHKFEGSDSLNFTALVLS